MRIEPQSTHNTDFGVGFAEIKFNLNCGSSARLDQAIEVETKSFMTELILYPNPANEYFEIVGNQKLSYKVEVYSTAGRLQKALYGVKFGIRVGVDDLSNGLYIVRIYSSDGALQQLKLQKQ